MTPVLSVVSEALNVDTVRSRNLHLDLIINVLFSSPFRSTVRFSQQSMAQGACSSRLRLHRPWRAFQRCVFIPTTCPVAGQNEYRGKGNAGEGDAAEE